jgi:predicted outer membrane repeat protein
MKKGRLILAVLLLFSLCLFSNVTRQSVIVPEEVETIQGAIDLAVSGDVIIVLPGTYTENIDFMGKELVVGSLYYTTQDTSYISQTVIDGGQNGSVVTFNSGEGGNSVLSGFTITNGVTSADGGGIYCGDNTSPLLDNLRVINNQASNGGGLFFGTNSSISIISTLISDNNATYQGGGAYLYYCDLIMNDVVLENNECVYTGGGMSITSSEIVMENVSVINNTASGSYGSGGGLFNYWESVIDLDSCLFEGNFAVTGGGICCDEMTALYLENTLIKENEASYSGGGIFFGWGLELSIVNSEIDNNTAGTNGGGLFLSGFDQDLNKVLITNNTAGSKGGGIFINGWSNVDLLNTTIVDNTAEENGGGIYADYNYNYARLINSVLWDNLPQALYLNYSGNTFPTEVTVAYSNFEGGYDAIGVSSYDNVIINWLEGNIDEEPGFIDQVGGNYQLLSNSPCIDSGTAYFEYNEEVLLNLEAEEYEGEAPDMGAYEFSGVKYGDINNDGAIDSYDASLLLMYVIGMDPLEDDPVPWEEWRVERADVNLDGEIEALDAALVLQNAVGLIELPVRGGIRGSSEITISSDEQYIYLNSDYELISFEYTISEYSNLEFRAGEVNYDNCLYLQKGDRMAIISAEGLSGNLVQIPYTRTGAYIDSYVTFNVISNGWHEQITYLLNGETPSISRISAVYPNPFNPETTIEYQLAQPGKTSIEVYNIKGQKIETLFNEEQDAGNYNFRWNADGQSSGVYFVRVKNGSFEGREKIILLK